MQQRESPGTYCQQGRQGNSLPACRGDSGGRWWGERGMGGDSQTVFHFLAWKLLLEHSGNHLYIYDSASWSLGGWHRWRIRIYGGKLSATATGNFLKKHPFIEQKSAVCVENAVKCVVLSWKRWSAWWLKPIWFQWSKERKSWRSAWFQCFTISS